MDSRKELEADERYLSWMPKVGSRELSCRNSKDKNTPQYPEKPDDIGCHVPEHRDTPSELESSSSHNHNDTDPTASTLAQGVHNIDEKWSELGSPGRSELEAPNMRNSGVSNTMQTLSRFSVNSQRMSRHGLRLSLPNRPFENMPAVDTIEHSRGLDTKEVTSDFPGSSLLAINGSRRLQADPKAFTAIIQDSHGLNVMSPMTPESVQHCGQCPNGVISPMVSPSFEPDTVSSGLNQAGSIDVLQTNNSIGARETHGQQVSIPDTMSTSAEVCENFSLHEHGEIPIVYRKQSRDNPWPNNFSPDDWQWPWRQEPQVSNQQHGIRTSPGDRSTVVRALPGLKIQTMPEITNADNFHRIPHQVAAIRPTSSDGEVYIGPGQQMLAAPQSDAWAQVEAQGLVLTSPTPAGYIINTVIPSSPIDWGTPASVAASFESNSYDSFTSRATSRISSLGHGSISGSGLSWTAGSTPASSIMETPSAPAFELGNSIDRLSKSFCPLCHFEFKGNHGNRTSNLKRHIRTVHRQGRRLPCKHPGCQNPGPFQRSDYLKKHYKNAHNIDNYTPSLGDYQPATSEGGGHD